MWFIVAYDRDNREVNRLEADSGEVTIGRDADRRLVLPSASVSRRHARIVLDGPQPYIMDEGSANGVVVNGVRIAAPTAILAGIRVDIAEFHLEFQVGNSPTEAVQPLAVPMPNGNPSDALRLLADGGPFDGRLFEIPNEESGVGRAVDNEIVVDDPSLSRKHARIRRAGPGRIEIEDLGSSNGSFVNGRKVGTGTATVGDAVRFGEISFRLEGPGGAGAVSTRNGQTPGSGKGWVVIAAALGVVLLLGGGIGVWFFLKRTHGDPGPGNASEQAAKLIAAGKEKMADKKFDAAAADFAEAQRLDPLSKEARRQKLLAEAEPANEKLAKSVAAKSTGIADRASFDTALRTFASIPDESMFKSTTAQKLMKSLVAFGDMQCKAKKWADCAFAMCKSFDVAPEGAKPDASAASADRWLRDAEKKLARDKSYTPCKKH